MTTIGHKPSENSEHTDTTGDLKGRRVLLVVCGSIAVFKSCLLVRALMSEGAQVRVLMTRGAVKFIQPLTFSYLTQHRVYLNDAEDTEQVDHIELAKWAEVIMLAPVTANQISRLAVGLADDLLGACILASSAQVWLAPAMNQAMWQKSVIQSHVDALRSRDWQIAYPASGLLACGDTGPGRMVEVTDLIEQLKRTLPACSEPQQRDSSAVDSPQKFSPMSETRAKPKVLLTMGATVESLDPVRYISNRSSGNMGWALFAALTAYGIDVRIVLARVASEVDARIDAYGSTKNFLRVQSGQQMYDTVMAQIQTFCPDVFIGVAAVCDYRPMQYSQVKLEKPADAFHLPLKLNPDIIATVKQKFPHIYTVGFSAQTDSIPTKAEAKLKAKGLDVLVANRVGQSEEAVDSLEGSLTQCIILKPNFKEDLGVLPKSTLALRLAEDILQHTVERAKTGAS